MKRSYCFIFLIFFCLNFIYSQQTISVDLTGEALTEKASTTDLPLSVEQSITKAINRATQRAEQVHLSNPTFSMDFTCEGIAISPQKNDLNWTWQLLTINGETVVAAPPQLKDNPQQEYVDYARGAITERYLFHKGSVEQLFIIAEQPQGDLNIAGTIQSEGHFEKQRVGWQWTNAQGSIQLGELYVYDAQGKEVTASFTVSSTRTNIHITAADLAAASYPLTIDPEIGPNDFRISDMGPDGNPNFAASDPSVAYNSTTNNYLVAWHGDDNTGSLVDGELEIFGQLINADGTENGSDFRISDMGPDGNPNFAARDPSVVYNSMANNYLVVWEGGDDTPPLVRGEEEIFGQLIDADGTEIGPNDFRISDMGPDGDADFDALDPSVAYNSTANNFLVVWRGDDNTPPLVNGEFEIFGQLINADGTENGIDFRISDMGPDGNFFFAASDPSVAYNSTANNYLVVWEGDDNTGSLVVDEFEIFGQLINADGTENGIDFRISDMGPDGNTSFDAFNPSVAYNSTDNNYLVVWTGDDNTPPLVINENEIFGQLINADGTENGIDFRISDMGPDGNTNFIAFDPSVAYNSTDNNYLVVWEGDDNTPPLVNRELEIFGQLINADGTENGIDFRISDMGPDGNTNFDALDPWVAYNSTANNYLVVWEGDDNTPPLVNDEFEIFGQLIGTPTLTIAPTQNGAEDATDGTFTVTSTNPFTFPTTVNITVGGTATEGTDYANIGTSFMFPANMTTATITVDVSADMLFEVNETVVITLAAGAAYMVGAAPNNIATLTITDNDPAPISINDPCSCTDPLNMKDVSGNITHFHDVLTIGGITGQSVVLTTGNTNFLDASLTQIADGTVLGTVPLSFDFFHAAGTSGDIVLTVGGATQPPFSISICEASTCIVPDPIPTMRSWGLLIFCLLVVNLSIWSIRRLDGIEK